MEQTPQQVQALLDANNLKLILIILVISLPSILKMLSDINKYIIERRTKVYDLEVEVKRGDLAQDQAERKEEVAHSSQLLEFARLMSDQGKRQDNLISLMQQMQDGADERNRTLIKTTTIMTNQSETLSTATDALSALTTAVHTELEVTHRTNQLILEKLDAVDQSIKAIPMGIMAELRLLEVRIDEVLGRG